MKDGIARIYGLQKAMAGEMLEVTSSETGEKITALALNLEEDNIGAVILGDYLQLKEGDEVRRTGRVLEVPVGPALRRPRRRRARPPDRRRGPDRTPRTTRKVEIEAPGIIVRQPVKEPLQTGIKAIDSMIPIGRGQRELIIGDRGTGKTAIAIDTIINQKGTGRHLRLRRHRPEGVDRRVGRRAAQARRARWSTRSSSSPRRPIRRRCSTSRPTPAARWPSTSCTTRASRRCACTTTSPSRPPRIASSRSCSAVRRAAKRIPGDVFYLHSRLLERAAKLQRRSRAIVDGKKILKPGGSLTALPIIETQAGDVSAYIPTNVISITDGQIFLEADLFFAGVRPAVNVGISVSAASAARRRSRR